MTITCSLLFKAFRKPHFNSRSSLTHSKKSPLRSAKRDEGVSLKSNGTLTSYHAHLVLSTSTEKCDLFGNTCTSYIAASDTARELTIVFRGSKTTGQIILQGLNSFVPMEFFGMGNVNRYFKNGVEVLWSPIKEVLTSTKYARYQIAFTGHSLGGALAVLAAARTVAEGLRRSDQVMVYTFGEPRVGDPTFAANFDKLLPNSYRVVFRHDIVPHLPPCIRKKKQMDKLVTSYDCDPNNPYTVFHHSTEIWYPHSMVRDSYYVECVGEPKGEDPGCSNKRIKFGYKEYQKSKFDHRHYFGLQVPEFGRNGCEITYSNGKPE
ncbi:hypothetical protein RB195_021144 [Necator americanus]|uniref:Fungal lipase-type domain-containing protein n=1 Tax=Necator americanus TaxID=51031 RepID=A0ABR1EA89_NECAM